jgi:hypothetical protein
MLVAEVLLIGVGFSPASLWRALTDVRANPPLILALYLIFLWWRVAALTSRDLSFFSVGLSFRFGMLVSLVGCSLLAFGSTRPDAESAALACLLIFFACGLTAAALARIDDKAFFADQSRGALLPWPRFAQLLAAVAATLCLAAIVAQVYAPGGFAHLFGWLSPVTSLLGQVLALLFAALLWLMTPLVAGLERLMAWLALEPLDPAITSPLEPPMPPGAYSIGDLLGASPLLRGVLIGFGVLIALALIALFFARTLDAMRRDEPEETEPEPLDLAPSAPRLRMPGWWGLARRYGLSRRLLAAVSVQNLYANVGRLARRRGFPRPPATPPDAYLPMLEQAFPGHAPALARLTDAYMRVHYGDAPASPAELAALRTDYEQLRTA